MASRGRRSLFTILLLELSRVSSFVALTKHMPRQVEAAGRVPVPLCSASNSKQNKEALKDALMNRAVETQINAFQLMHDSTQATFLNNVWQNYTTSKQQPGTLTNFLDHLHRSEPTEVFTPRISFRKLSPGNPYADKMNTANGYYSVIEPTQVAMRLMDVRKCLAETWVGELDRLSLSTTASSAGELAPAEPAEPAVLREERCPDEQLLRGLATKRAAREILHDLSLLPSHEHVHKWLGAFILTQHGRDLTREGNVETLLTDLADQPLHFRGGALVDPREILVWLLERTGKNCDAMSTDLHDCTAEQIAISSCFLEGCLLL